ncbi:hypothetical protein BH11BAC3_BH11BAC3_45030 [soil metagenome]
MLKRYVKKYLIRMLTNILLENVRILFLRHTGMLRLVLNFIGNSLQLQWLLCKIKGYVYRN